MVAEQRGAGRGVDEVVVPGVGLRRGDADDVGGGEGLALDLDGAGAGGSDDLVAGAKGGAPHAGGEAVGHVERALHVDREGEVRGGREALHDRVAERVQVRRLTEHRGGEGEG